MESPRSVPLIAVYVREPMEEMESISLLVNVMESPISLALTAAYVGESMEEMALISSLVNFMEWSKSAAITDPAQMRKKKEVNTHIKIFLLHMICLHFQVGGRDIRLPRSRRRMTHATALYHRLDLLLN
jgi:hypothetical protein